VTRKLVALLYADVAGYSRLTGADEVGTHEQLSASLDLIAKGIEAAQGRVVHYAGDAVLAEFQSVVTAVETALGIQRSLADAGAGIDEKKRIKYRIGINLGEVIVDRNDVYGDGVNIAARLESLAEPGGVCVSDDVYRQVNGKIAAHFRDLGEQELKNISGRVRAYHVGLAPSMSVPDSREAPTADTLQLPDKPSIAVLPFDNMSGDPEQEYFSDGVAEDIITALSSFRSIFVIARNSSFVYKGVSTDIKQIGVELGVRYVLEGSVRKSATRVRITAQLIEAASGVHLWAQRYDRELEDVFALQDEITETIVAAIQPELEVAERERARKKPSGGLDAWDSYQRGMWHAYKFNDDDASLAEACFLEALAIAPHYAPALTGLAWIYFHRVIFHYPAKEPISRDDLLQRGLDRASAAVQADNKDAFAQFVYGRLLSLNGDFDEAIERLLRAIEFNPNYALAYHGLGYALALGGSPGEAIAQFDKALRLSPQDPYRWAFLAMRACALVLNKEYEGAVEWGRRAVSDKPEVFWAHVHFTSALGHLERHEEAARAFADLLKVKPGFSRETVDETIRFRHTADREHFLEGLEKAGLPR